MGVFVITLELSIWIFETFETTKLGFHDTKIEQSQNFCTHYSCLLNPPYINSERHRATDPILSWSSKGIISSKCPWTSKLYIERLAAAPPPYLALRYTGPSVLFKVEKIDNRDQTHANIVTQSYLMAKEKIKPSDQGELNSATRGRHRCTIIINHSIRIPDYFYDWYHPRLSQPLDFNSNSLTEVSSLGFLVALSRSILGVSLSSVALPPDSFRFKFFLEPSGRITMMRIQKSQPSNGR